MSETDPDSELRRCRTRLQHRVVDAALATRLAEQSESATETLRATILRDVGAFNASGNPDVLPELRAHIAALVEHARQGVEKGEFSFDYARHHAVRRADQRFPLEALLSAYRSAQRTLAQELKDATVASRLPDTDTNDAATAATDYATAYVDALSSVVTAAYVTQTRRVAEAEGDQRTELLSTLLGGYDEADGRTAQLLRRSGYLEQRQSFCVVAARSVDPREMQNPARAQRMIDAISAALRDFPVRCLFGVRDGLAIVVVSGARRASGWTAPRSSLADRLLPKLTQIGPAALIGVSNDAPSTSHIRRAHQEARHALDFATVSRRVMPFARVPLRETIVRHALINRQSVLPAWLDAFLQTDRKARGRLSATLRAYADANMNALKTGSALKVHPNTIYARMQKVADVTGKNPLRYHDLTDLLLAIDCSSELS